MKHVFADVEQVFADVEQVFADVEQVFADVAHVSEDVAQVSEVVAQVSGDVASQFSFRIWKLQVFSFKWFKTNIWKKNEHFFEKKKVKKKMNFW